MKRMAEQFKALSDETRLKILSLLTEQDLCVCEIIDALNMTQSAVSHHLKILKNAGFVEDRREGKWIFYQLTVASLQTLGDNLVAQFIRPACEKDRSSTCNRDIASICERIQSKENKGVNTIG
ncbi:MAG: metalloregulator ArsR/SmtB family transcription factor [Bacillota bacterium]|nr:metalloregulator ArsR/SmtB family transcription factor [Bacillota bacterium]